MLLSRYQPGFVGKFEQGSPWKTMPTKSKDGRLVEGGWIGLIIEQLGRHSQCNFDHGGFQ